MAIEFAIDGHGDRYLFEKNYASIVRHLHFYVLLLTLQHVNVNEARHVYVGNARFGMILHHK